MPTAIDSRAHRDPTIVGLSLWLPVLVAVAMAAVTWEWLFATLRRRGPDPGWAMSCWLFALLMPAGTSVTLAVVGMSFGIVFGSLVFGGTGRYIVSPAALGALFVHFAYPSALPPDADWHRLVVDGTLAPGAEATWWLYFAGREHGLIGTGSALAIFAGALFLVRARVVSARTIGGAIIGMSAAATVAWIAGGPLPPHWQFAVGSGTFCLVFLLTSILSNGLSAFSQTFVTLEVTLDEAKLIARQRLPIRRRVWPLGEYVTAQPQSEPLPVVPGEVITEWVPTPADQVSTDFERA